MDKITRIHLAKIPYEISVNAQEELKKYLDAIRDELDANLADEIMTDIEVRLTEILSERGVKRNDVITTKDIDAVQEQLGSPEQFTEDETKSKPSHVSDGESKRLLRNPEDAYIGGVASGIGAYFGIDPIFIRLVFIALTFLSGLGILLYILIWILVPAAKSSSDKLQMSGQPVTAATLQGYRASVQKRLGNRPNNIQKAIAKACKVIGKILKILVTIFSGLACLYILGILGIGSSFTFVYPFRPLFISYRTDYIALGLLWVIGLIIIGLLITLIMRIWGHRSTQLKFSAISLLSVLVIALAGSGATGVLVYNHFSDKYGNGKDIASLAVNNLSPNVQPTKLVLKSDANLNLTYVITNQPIHASYAAYPGLIARPKLTISSSNGVLSVNSADLAQAAPTCLNTLCSKIYLPIHVTVYGPAINSITDNSGATLSINNANFGKSLSVNGSYGATININNSYAANMNITAETGSNIDASSSNAQQTVINVADADMSSTVYAPETVNLTAALPNNCNQDGIQVLYLNGYSGQVKVNGLVQTNNELNQNACVSDSF